MNFIAVRPLKMRTLFIILLCVTATFTKECKKLTGSCSCEMNDGSGTIDLTAIDNKNGTPRFTNIPASGAKYKYNYNPCTPITKLGAVCKGTNLCQEDDKGTFYPCGLSGPTFTVKSDNKVVLVYKNQTYSSYTRSTEITLVCDPSNKGSIESIKQDHTGKSSSVYEGTLKSKSACPVPSGSSSSGSEGLSPGSIILTVFFAVLLLYLIVGIIFNVKVKKKESVPEVFPNHEFWADCPFLVKDGCIFTFFKIKSCCSFLCAKARREAYAEI